MALTEELELSQNLENYNTVKEAIINGLVREQIITSEVGTDIKSNYAVVLVKGNWFGSTIGKFLNRESTVIKLVKIV